MLQIRWDASVPAPVRERLGPPLERAACGWSGLGEAFVHCVRCPHGGCELAVRVGTIRGVVPLLFPLDRVDAGAVETALKGTLMRADL
jgi:hypothetical protein